MKKHQAVARDFQSIVLKKLVKSKMMKNELARKEVYGTLGIGLEKELPAANVLRFVELLISLAEERKIRFKAINRNEIYFKVVYQLKRDKAEEKFKKTDNWQVRIKKFYRPRKPFGKFFGMNDVFYRIWIRNKVNPHPEVTAEWEARERSNDLLAFRLGKLMEVVFYNLYRM